MPIWFVCITAPLLLPTGKDRAAGVGGGGWGGGATVCKTPFVAGQYVIDFVTSETDTSLRPNVTGLYGEYYCACAFRIVEGGY